jgi:hypothetical protein
MPFGEAPVRESWWLVLRRFTVCATLPSAPEPAARCLAPAPIVERCPHGSTSGSRHRRPKTLRSLSLSNCSRGAPTPRMRRLPTRDRSQSSTHWGSVGASRWTMRRHGRSATPLRVDSGGAGFPTGWNRSTSSTPDTRGAVTPTLLRCCVGCEAKPRTPGQVETGARILASFKLYVDGSTVSDQTSVHRHSSLNAANARIPRLATRT